MIKLKKYCCGGETVVVWNCLLSIGKISGITSIRYNLVKYRLVKVWSRFIWEIFVFCFYSRPILQWYHWSSTSIIQLGVFWYCWILRLLFGVVFVKLFLFDERNSHNYWEDFSKTKFSKLTTRKKGKKKGKRKKRK